MKPSTKNEVAGNAKEIKGRIKQGIGNATNKPELKNEGTADRVEGKVQKKVGQIQKVLGK